MMEAANQEARSILEHVHEFFDQDRNIWTIGGIIKNLVIEDPSAESWNSAYEKLVMNWTTIGHPKFMCQILFKKLEEVGCREKSSAWNIAQFIFFCLGRNFQFFQSFYTLQNNASYSLDFYRSYVSKFNVQCIRQNNQPQTEVDFSKFLLNYDLLQPIDIHSEHNLEVVRLAICSSMVHTPEIEQLNFTYDSLDKINGQTDLLRKLRSSDGKFKGAFQRGFKRLMLTAKCVRALEKCHRLTADDQYYAQCMRLYFRGVTDPFVQAEEVRELLSFFLVDVKKEVIDAMVTVFQSLFPESEAPYGPRSLQHLCRCQVRGVLSPKSEALPELVKKIKIPLRIKMYILGDF